MFKIALLKILDDPWGILAIKGVYGTFSSKEAAAKYMDGSQNWVRTERLIGGWRLRKSAYDFACVIPSHELDSLPQ